MSGDDSVYVAGVGRVPAHLYERARRAAVELAGRAPRAARPRVWELHQSPTAGRPMPDDPDARALFTLEQRRDWLTARITAKESMGWETEYDRRERDALTWALERLT